MLSLEQNHITELYSFIDDFLPEPVKPTSGGRPALLSDSELVTILLWNGIALRQQTLKDLHRSAFIYHRQDFPRLPGYSAFVDHCHRVIPVLHWLLENLLQQNGPLRFMDATMLPVCKLVRADSHKVARGVADFGKNHQGWHYGFKLHAGITPDGALSAVLFTPASVYDAQALPNLLSKQVKVMVGDTLYGASVMRRQIWEQYGTVIIAPPFPSQKKKLLTWWQDALLKARPKIESVFDYLKEHMQLVSSFPRSVSGYALHYLRILLSYQLLVITE